MTASAQKIPILMYHSVSQEQGPTSIAPAVFEAQMEAIASAGWNVATLSSYAAWRLHGETLSPRTLVITFDDAYQDFADAAFPILERLKFPATIFVPTGHIGGTAAWSGAAGTSKPVMGWSTIRELASRGMAFAPHGRTHASLAALGQDELHQEIVGSRQDLETHLGSPAHHFAPPFGKTSPAADAIIRATYDISVGVSLGIANRHSPAHATPRLEMFYYRNIQRWLSFLSGTGGTYLAARQCARSVRRALTRSPAYE